LSLRCLLLLGLGDFGFAAARRGTYMWRCARGTLATGLLTRLEELGGRCDCEVLMNVFPHYPTAGRLLPCAGQPAQGSAVPCDLQVLRRTA